MNRLSPSTSRFAAWALLTLAVLFVLMYGLVPVLNHYGEKYRETVALRNQLQRFEYLIANEPAINRELERIEALGAEGDLFLKGSKPSIASANLREFVNEAVRRSGGQLVSSQEYEGGALESTTPIGLRLQVSGEVQNLVDLLYQLENARPVIFIDDLSVTSNSSRERVSRHARRAQRANIISHSLDIRMDIVGYLPGEGAP